MGPYVDTRYGKLEGLSKEGCQRFRGIPYAQPPVGALRFQAPQPAKAWTGMRKATEFGKSAPQADQGLANLSSVGVGPQSEDCLYLNVVTPNADSRRRPVMVWIHGGAFKGGSGSQALYRGDALARCGDVVVVTLNYRLGALGFLALDEIYGQTFADAGNLGILDQIAALSWVRENIAAFGGDPENVTIFGESAGGMSVGALLGAPSARGLFQRAIAQSGAARHVSNRKEARPVAEAFLAKLGLEGSNPQRLREAPVPQILAAQEHCLQALADPLRDLLFQPVVDGRTFPQHPLDAVRGGLAAQVPLLVGTTHDEWSFWGMADPRLRQLDEEGLRKRLRARIAEGRPESEREAWTERVLATYRKARKGSPSLSAAELFVAIQTDRIFRFPATQLAEAQAAHQAQTYVYIVTWESPAVGGKLGSCHGIDVPFVFGLIGRSGLEGFVGEGEQAQRLSERMMDAWLCFARSGDPNHPDLPSWPSYDQKKRPTMFLGPKCELKLAPYDAERQVWDALSNGRSPA